MNDVDFSPPRSSLNVNRYPAGHWIEEGEEQLYESHANKDNGVSESPLDLVCSVNTVDDEQG